MWRVSVGSGSARPGLGGEAGQSWKWHGLSRGARTVRTAGFGKAVKDGAFRVASNRRESSGAAR